MTDDLDRMLSGGAKGFKFDKPGDTVTGIIDRIDVRQATEYGTGKPLTFDNGDPREQIVVQLRTENVPREDEDDDGVRAVYIKGWGVQRRAFISAADKSGKPAVGDRFTATLTGLEPSKTGGFPAKVYEYRIERLQAEADGAWASQGEVATAVQTAEKLLGMGMTAAQVAVATGLDAAEVAGLSKQSYPDDTPF